MKRGDILDRLRKWWATASAVILLVIAVLGLLYDAFHKLAGPDLVGHLATPEEVLIFLVALLCGGLGAERLLTLKKIENDIELAQEQRGALMEQTRRISRDIEKVASRIGKTRSEIAADLKLAGRREEELIAAVKRIHKIEALIGTMEIEAAARRLISDCNDSERIKATGQYRVGGDGLSPDYFAHVAERVARAQKNQGGMEYLVVVASPPVGEQRQDDERVKIFRERRVEERLKIRGTKHQWPFEVLIGGHSMIIALLGGDTKAKYEVALKITDHDFVEKAAEWYSEVAWDGAERI